MTALAALAGARLRRIDAPNPDLWALTLAAGELRGTLLFSLQPRAAGVGWLEKRPHGLPASSFVQKLRKEIEGGRVLGFEADGPRLLLRIARSQREFLLAFDFDSQNVLLYADEKLLASAHKPAPAADGGAPMSWPQTLELLAERGQALIESRADGLLANQRSVLGKATSAARKRLLRKLEAQRGDAARAERAPDLRRRAQLLLSQQHAIPRGASSAKLLDYGVDPPEWVELTLDAKLGAREQAEAWFKQAKRFERGAAIAHERAADGERELAALDALQLELAACATAEQLAALIPRAAALGLQAEGASAPAQQRKEPPKRVPYRLIVGTGERKILVGKGAADNDALTLQYARPHDLWLHARDVSGAHVVVPLEKAEVCPQELLLDAAHLAAHFSDSRGERVVDVAYTQRRYVRKPKGAAVGSVLVEKEKVLRLVVEAERLTKLLARG